VGSRGTAVGGGADDDVASEDGARGHLVVDQVGNDGAGQGELDGRGVDDADDVAGAGCLEEAKERPVAAGLCVELERRVCGVVGSRDVRERLRGRLRVQSGAGDMLSMARAFSEGNDPALRDTREVAGARGGHLVFFKW